MNILEKSYYSRTVSFPLPFIIRPQQELQLHECENTVYNVKATNNAAIKKGHV